MCGIWGVILKEDNFRDNNIKITEQMSSFFNSKHRGPDFSSINVFENSILGFHRLSINDLSIRSNQPFFLHTPEKTIAFVCNGEIYNYKDLYKKYFYEMPVEETDCKIILQLYLKFGDNEFLTLFEREIRGEFAFILFEFCNVNNSLKKVMVGRDMIGVRPLYKYDDSEVLFFSSEMKSMMCLKEGSRIKEYSPGVISCYEFNDQRKHKKTSVYNFKIYKRVKAIYAEDEFYLESIRKAFYRSMEYRLDTTQELSFLLSGGIDSSIVASISTKILNRPIHTFCCGLKDSPDIKYARIVSQHIGSIHHEVLFSKEEGVEMIDHIIYVVETWDTTTIRASICQYIISKYIREHTQSKIILVGEGPDEVCSSYLFNWYCPENSEELHKTSMKYVSNLHYFDLKRVDKCVAYNKMESRVPFLDPDFICSYWQIPSELRHPKYKNCEKWWLREAFKELLPEEVVWRKKEAFSDGVSSESESWFDVLKNHIESLVSDEEFRIFCETHPQYNINKEAYYYKKKFTEYFGRSNTDIIPHYWQPEWIADGVKCDSYVDPSARNLNIYQN